MFLNRRTMLQASIGAIALGLSGCTKGKITSIIFANATADIIATIDAFAAGKEYADTAIPPDKYSKRGDFPTTAKVKGKLVPLTGTITFVASPAIDLGALGLNVKLGSTNTYTVHGDGTVTLS